MKLLTIKSIFSITCYYSNYQKENLVLLHFFILPMYQFFNFSILWFFDTLILFLLILWFLLCWLFALLILWFFGSLDLWIFGSLDLWFYGSLDLWFLGLFLGSLVLGFIFGLFGFLMFSIEKSWNWSAFLYKNKIIIPLLYNQFCPSFISAFLSSLNHIDSFYQILKNISYRFWFDLYHHMFQFANHVLKLQALLVTYPIINASPWNLAFYGHLELYQTYSILNDAKIRLNELFWFWKFSRHRKIHQSEK